MGEPKRMLDTNVLRSLASNSWKGPFDWVDRLYARQVKWTPLARGRD
jgi:hypothetical protein